MRVCGAQDKCHPQTIEVCQTRADGLGLEVVVGEERDFRYTSDVCGVLLQYPATDGTVHDYKVGGEGLRGWWWCAMAWKLWTYLGLEVIDVWDSS